ncbi:stage II sporulation protein M [Candidatus Nitrosopumilus sediminis]|uniref:Stage II sporulation protein M n=1 Tax=Candidatus Nitrosopumilus sediminis TaxID=1229909 RepID=K0BGX1_9ARCH|nr:stage II sporulation protein M [Candidatus Nitrosopumilus sediminis]AFS83496.1 hypothetical protein NSED_08520 [Candidatus Nitrosopumilus sediminis]
MLKIRIILFFVFLGLFSVSFQVGAMYDISDEEANEFVQEFLSNTNAIDGIGIFLNNMTAALPMFIPGFGMFWGAYTAWSTGFGFAAILNMAPGLADMVPLSVLYLSSFGFMELVAYSIAMSRSLYVILALIKRTNMKSLVKLSAIEIGIVTAMLLSAGFLEEYMINSTQGI